MAWQIGRIFSNIYVYIWHGQIGRVDFDTQIEWFGNTAQQLRSQLGPKEAQKLLAQSLFITVFGSNDYVNNYLLSYSPLNKVFSPPEFKDVILQKIATQITVKYPSIHPSNQSMNQSWINDQIHLIHITHLKVHSMPYHKNILTFLKV